MVTFLLNCWDGVEKLEKNYFLIISFHLHVCEGLVSVAAVPFYHYTLATTPLRL